MKCDLCGSPNCRAVTEDFNTRQLDYRRQEIIVEKVKSFACDDCSESWIPSEELKRIEAEIEKRKYQLLSPSEIKMIRESLPFNSKREISEFLCLNEKAFVKWEKGYTEMNRAYDLLLRLIVRSKDNFDFVKALHAKNFIFDTGDYYFLRKMSVSGQPRASTLDVNIIDHLKGSSSSAEKSLNESQYQDYALDAEAA